MADYEIKVDIGEGRVTSDKSQGGTADKGSSTGISKGIKGALKSVGIVAGLAFIVDLVLSFKPLVSVIKNIGKMLSLLLKPIADVVMFLLMPILMILKPIVKAVNSLMRPFYRQAMLFMKAGELKKGTLTIFAGIQLVIIKLISESIKFLGGALISILASVFGIVSEDAQKEMMNKLLPAFYTIVDDSAALISTGIVIGIAALSDSSNVEFGKFVTSAVDSILTNYPNISEAAKKSIEEIKITTIAGDFKDALDLLATTFVDSWGRFANTAIESLLGVFSAMLAAITGTPTFEELEAEGLLKKSDPWIVKFLATTPGFSDVLYTVGDFLGNYYSPKMSVYNPKTGETEYDSRSEPAKVGVGAKLAGWG